MWSSCCVKCSTIKKTKKIWRKKGINQKSTNKQEIKQRQSSVDRLPTVWKCRSGPIIIIIVIISAIRRYYVIFISYIAYHYTHTTLTYPTGVAPQLSFSWEILSQTKFHSESDFVFVYYQCNENLKDYNCLEMMPLSYKPWPDDNVKVEFVGFLPD